MKLYEFEAFPNPRRVRMFLAEKAIEVERQQIDVPAGEHREADFLEKNPYAEVPTLELDDGSCISETIAICRYFEARQPEPALMGEDSKTQAEIEMWQRRIEATLLGSTAHYFHHATEGLGEPDRYRNPSWGERSRENAIAAIHRLDDELCRRPFVAGESFSVADITALCAIDFANAVGIETPPGLEHLARWHATVSSRPSASA